MITMSPSLPTLRDNNVDALRFQPLRLGNGGSGRENFCSPAPDPPEQFRGGQTKMKTDDFRLQLRDRFRGFNIEWPPLDGGSTLASRLNSQLLVIASEFVTP